ncbi:HEPN domain-containing protein [Mangrovimonas sp. YM274]|uniref:HEPN domain-containing protein n=1 Tax=Mangrovimonas sp. YM274 TaxID=3070660 RepID=UPI0027DBBEF6|nr:HEPN domain-containing protein [Mangrovimonas sp. YM274]WMI69039.1 HEPN domain-containing protein [Mangrovimonas sp. YM274]
MTKLTEEFQDWIFITPIHGLELTKDVKQEFTVNRVTFVAKSKLPRIRKRLGLPTTFSDLTNIIPENHIKFKERIDNFFKTEKTFAVLPYKGNPKEKQNECIRLILEELNILSLSQIGWSNRQFNKKLEIKTSDNTLIYQTIHINKHKKTFNNRYQNKTNIVPLILDNKWVNFHKSFFFFELLKVIRGETSVSKKWRTKIHRTSAMVGQSQNSNDLTFCLIWNVIALEMLLINDEDKISSKLISRCEYFLGWHEAWVNEKYAERIKEIYSKRCEFVHKGDTKLIETKDLIFTDDLIFNLLNNIIRCKSKFLDFKDILNYSEKYEAEKVLNIKSKYQFGKFQLMTKKYSEEECKNI